MRVLTAGVPLHSKGILDGLDYIKKLGLDGMEVEFVRGVRLKGNTLRKIGETARQLGLTLSIHAPYYINLASLEQEKIDRSIEHIMASVRAGEIMRAYDVVFHPAFYQGRSSDEVMSMVRSAIEKILLKMDKEGLKNVILRPETMGKKSQFGDLDEIITLSSEFDGRVLPCVDFAHLHARTGKMNTYQEFSNAFDSIRKVLGDEAVRKLHLHLSGIEYTSKGEKKHLPFIRSDFNLKGMVELLRNSNYDGNIVVESPNIEGDALLLKLALEGKIPIPNKKLSELSKSETLL